MPTRKIHAGDEGPITVAVSRKVRPGREAEYEDWVKGVTDAALEFPGHLGVNVLRPGPSTDNEYVIIYRFDSYAHARAWDESAERAEFTARLEPLVEGDTKVKRVTGLEFWFDLPTVPAGAKPPSKHKMALVLAVVVFTMLLLLNLLFNQIPLLARMHWIPRLAVVVVLQIGLLTYLVMPQVTRLLKPWLYR
ncbi:antibiotic biosynthesis monooxygenase [Alkalilimnicola sp. S0819]|uniref:antibiotic biosynthesis monooxygenase n=1 Tax=Alkalilimnicola sp. S0819 TaxID=2613922 RepID=UPI0012624452|nr:antibiotic biosynthesis monooxygenase [Alkalilimnicola sp. S0819]KAB7623325.1 antibiotic biosynthesis monooxygenase [Alkalilimnicola sp. S0819]MPQ16863.1 antibiotic biosynthesis monooxygenase [Alkalilimnicola sp. S0819]